MLASHFSLAIQIPLRKTYVLGTLMWEKKQREGGRSEIIVRLWQVKCCDLISDTEPVPSEWTSEMFFSSKSRCMYPTDGWENQKELL